MELAEAIKAPLKLELVARKITLSALGRLIDSGKSWPQEPNRCRDSFSEIGASQKTTSAHPQLVRLRSQHER